MMAPENNPVAFAYEQRLVVVDVVMEALTKTFDDMLPNLTPEEEDVLHRFLEVFQEKLSLTKPGH